MQKTNTGRGWLDWDEREPQQWLWKRTRGSEPCAGLCLLKWKSVSLSLNWHIVHFASKPQAGQVGSSSKASGRQWICLCKLVFRQVLIVDLYVKETSLPAVQEPLWQTHWQDLSWDPLSLLHPSCSHSYKQVFSPAWHQLSIAESQTSWSWKCFNLGAIPKYKIKA